jgi:hypothetical protein
MYLMSLFTLYDIRTLCQCYIMLYYICYNDGSMCHMTKIIMFRSGFEMPHLCHVTCKMYKKVYVGWALDLIGNIKGDTSRHSGRLWPECRNSTGFLPEALATPGESMVMPRLNNDLRKLATCQLKTRTIYYIFMCIIYLMIL